VLIALGSSIPRGIGPAAPPRQLTVTIVDSSRPAELVAPAAPVTALGRTDWAPEILWALWLAGAAAVLLRWSIRWHRVQAICRSARPAERRNIKLLCSPHAAEPGVVGIFRPVMLVPEGLAERLSTQQWESVVAHEMCHIRRRDNLSAAIHMLVEALFWFHPLVWWIGARLVEERERACDEEVLRLGGDPEIYAESILKVCQFCLEPPLPCVSGISGADLQKRIAGIMTRSIGRPLGIGKKLLLAALAAAALVSPLAIGLLDAPTGHAQSQSAAPLSFEVASVKRLDPNVQLAEPLYLSPIRSGGSVHWVANQYSLIRYAFRLQNWRMSGIEMSDTDYQIDAKTDPSATEDQIRLMFQDLLTKRFKLAVHRETREVNGYALTVARNGAKIAPAPDGEKAPPMPDYLHNQASFSAAWEGKAIVSKEGKGTVALTARRVSMSEIAEAMQGPLGTFVLDKTGLAGRYYIGLRFADPNRESDDPTLAGALQEELGLKLEKQKGPVEMLVVDHIEKEPVEN
jgi:bla regulator protein blaR1